MHPVLTMIRFGCLLAAVCGSSQVVFAGDLNPPPGPIQVTDRFILNQATTPGPYVIGVSGSYKLTSDISGGGPGFVIQVLAPDVTIDLNGFTIEGGGLAANGIQVANTDVTIRNGHVRNCAAEGVYSASDGTVVEQVAVRDSFEGISVANGGRVAECTVRDVQGDGIDVTFSCTVEDCTVVRSGLGGFGWGIVAREGSAVVGSTVRDSQNGIQGTGSATIDRCATSSNGSVGFLAENGVVVRGCSSRFNNTGFLVRNSTVLDSIAFQSFLYGFEMPNDARVDRCSSVESTNSGFWLGDRSTVTNCNSARDAAAGIGAGFETTGSYNRVSNNTAIESSNDNFLINGLLNTVYANSAANAGSGVNYNVAPANDVAPQTPAALSASGNENISN